MSLENAFRELRAVWFREHMTRRGPEREWETAEQEQARDRRNEQLRQRYDADTEAILRGEGRTVAPRCEADLG